MIVLMVLLFSILIFLCYWIYKLRNNQLVSFDKVINEKQKTINEMETSENVLKNSLISLGNRAVKKAQELNETYASMEVMLTEAMFNRVDKYREEMLEKAKQSVDTQIEEEKTQRQEEINKLEQYKLAKRLELGKVLDELSTQRAAIEAINKDILSRRALEEKQDFYRVCLPDDAIGDIQLLMSIRPNLTKRENLDKMIYDNYVAKPTLEMIKRVLEGRAPSGIYKITRLKTGEVYIGRSTDVKSRWQQHIKTAFGCGTIAHSILHRTMEKDGVENFTFELVEECPKEKLGEREKFWIDFYGSKQYGLNEKAGG